MYKAYAQSSLKRLISNKKKKAAKYNLVSVLLSRLFFSLYWE